MKDQFNPDEANKYCQYLDSKNLYGCAVIQKLPTFEFAWEKVDSFLLLITGEKTRTVVYFRSPCRVSKRAAQET